MLSRLASTKFITSTTTAQRCRITQISTIWASTTRVSKHSRQLGTSTETWTVVPTVRPNAIDASYRFQYGRSHLGARWVTQDQRKGGQKMALYFLTYDLRKSRNYQPLYDELDNFNAVRILESTWCFKRVNIDAKGLRDYFKKVIDDDDGLMVSQVDGWASYKTDGTPNKLA
jgi:hypothetical protein